VVVAKEFPAEENGSNQARKQKTAGRTSADCSGMAGLRGYPDSKRPPCVPKNMALHVQQNILPSKGLSYGEGGFFEIFLREIALL